MVVPRIITFLHEVCLRAIVINTQLSTRYWKGLCLNTLLEFSFLAVEKFKLIKRTAQINIYQSNFQPKLVHVVILHCCNFALPLVKSRYSDKKPCQI